ncbi:MAG TPA: DUF397 domain-containing protein [Mycobacteriales bacterium]|nr:DUF397 domain-containing protein [Mycobacteriales bacterium]
MDLPRAAWPKSSRSGAQGNCVEVADNLVTEHGAVLVRDSKNPTGPSLRFTPTERTAFVTGAKAGAFDPI